MWKEGKYEGAKKSISISGVEALPLNQKTHSCHKLSEN